MQKCCVDFKDNKVGGEHPVENYMVFKKYIDLIERNLEKFLSDEKIMIGRLLDACQRISEVDETSLYCIDYIMACTEYQEFYNLMIQYKVRIYIK